jgi:hypothetical protein
VKKVHKTPHDSHACIPTFKFPPKWLTHIHVSCKMSFCTTTLLYPCSLTNPHSHTPTHIHSHNTATLKSHSYVLGTHKITSHPSCIPLPCATPCSWCFPPICLVIVHSSSMQKLFLFPKVNPACHPCNGPSGYWWPPTYSNWHTYKCHLGSFNFHPGIFFLSFRVLNFQGRFETLNNVLWAATITL